MDGLMVTLSGDGERRTDRVSKGAMEEKAAPAYASQ